MKSITSLIAVALLGAMSAGSVNAANPETVTVRLDLDRNVLPSETVERTVIKLALAPMRITHRERPPVNLALVIDRSGSMGGDKIARAREAAIELVGRLEADDIVSLVAYDSAAEVLVPAQRVGDGHRLVDAIHRIYPNGGTALYSGVVRGADEVRRNLENRRYINRVILLSDGQANEGPSTPDELGRLGSSLLKDGISVTTIGLGLGYNEDLMARLAQRSDGNTYFVENSDDLGRIFAAELGDVLNVVARRVVIELEFPEWVRPIAFVGREGSIRGQRAELTLNQLYGGQEKFALVEVEVRPSASGSEREIARARVSYEDAVNQRSANATAVRTVQFSASRAAVIASADKQVQVDYAANVMAIAKEEAIALVDANRRDEAAQRMRDRASELKSMGEIYSNSTVVAAAKAAAPEADRLEREGLSSAGRKIYRTDAANTTSQQSIGRVMNP